MSLDWIHARRSIRKYTAERVEGFTRLLGMPAHVIPFAFVPIGHPAESKPPARRYAPERVHHDRW